MSARWNGSRGRSPSIGMTQGVRTGHGGRASREPFNDEIPKYPRKPEIPKPQDRRNMRPDRAIRHSGFWFPSGLGVSSFVIHGPRIVHE